MLAPLARFKLMTGEISNSEDLALWSAVEELKILRLEKALLSILENFLILHFSKIGFFMNGFVY